MRRWLIIFTPLLLASSEPRTSMPDVNEAGRVLAGLTDSQAALFALMFTLVAVLTFGAIAIWLLRGSSKANAELIADSQNNVAAALQSLVVTVSARDTDTNVNLAMIRHGVDNVLASLK